MVDQVVFVVQNFHRDGVTPDIAKIFELRKGKVCVCVRARVCACMYVCVCVCVRVGQLHQ